MPIPLNHEVVAVDVAADKVALVNAGRSPIVEDAIDGLIANVVASGWLEGGEEAIPTTIHWLTARTRRRHSPRQAEP